MRFSLDSRVDVLQLFVRDGLRLLQAQNGSVATPTSLPPTGARRREQRAREKFTEYNLHRKDKYRHKIRGLISEDDDEEMMDDEDGT